MAQMKNKTNETKNVHSVYSVICGHDKSAPYSWCTWVKHWCTWTIRSVHSVGVGVDSSRPFTPNCINAITHHSGCTWCKRWCTWVNITCSWNKHWLRINNSSVHSIGDRFIAPVHTELYKCNHASQWVYVGKTLVYVNNSSVHSVGVGVRFIVPVRTE